MPFKPGHKKVGGRKKGTPNRYTEDVRKILKDVVFNELENIPDILEELPPEKRIDVFLKLIPFVFPKVNNVVMDDGEPKYIRPPEEQFRYKED
ncbi:hypothetical protein [Flagellimonas oceanensis]|uniref:hypothetical protein n=1 Tax=Flagellimonas oceanensis TaxID=2499163 RepID=UPI000F8DE2D0|nr:hypothetical protein [Allomuricauda oceanensis]